LATTNNRVETKSKPTTLATTKQVKSSLYLALHTTQISKQLYSDNRNMIQQCKVRLYSSSKRKYCHCSAEVSSVL